MVSLDTLMIPNKEVEIEFPGIDGFKVKLAFQSRESLIAIRKKATNKKFSRSREMIEEVDDQLFLELYVRAVLKGWSGLKLKHLEKLVLVDLSDQPNLEVELPYSEGEALKLMKASVTFDQWVSDTVSDLANFPKSSSKVLKT
jgi:hypothetical protein